MTLESLKIDKNICLNIYLGDIILICLIKSISILLQSMGASLKSTLLSLSRDVIFFVPTIILTANISKSVVTMLYSSIISDILAFIFAIILLIIELKNMNSQENDNN